MKFFTPQEKAKMCIEYYTSTSSLTNFIVAIKGTGLKPIDPEFVWEILAQFEAMKNAPIQVHDIEEFYKDES